MTCADDDRTGRLQDSESESPVVGLRGEGDARQAAERFHAGHGPHPHPNCPVCAGDARQQAAETLSSRLVRERDEARALEQQARMGWDESRRRERELRRRVQEAERALRLAAETFEDFATALPLLGHGRMGLAAQIALDATRAVLGGDVPEEKLLTGKHPKQGGEATVALYDDEGNLVGGDVQEQETTTDLGGDEVATSGGGS